MNQTDSIVKVKINIKVVNCSGGKGASGHPIVYYNFGNKKKVQCQYCGIIFLKSN